jgi:membrane protein DedA with SNARE-associated domain
MLISLPAQLSYSAVAAIVFAESAGLPVPGESALLAAGLYVGAGKLALPLVVVVAAIAAILGDNLGFAIGRRGGRRLALKPGKTASWRRRALADAEGFFDRYGHAAVFLARWVPVARYLTPLTAGAAAMPWRRFLAYNAAGAICWCFSLVVIAALLGPMAAASVSLAGLALTAAGALAGVKCALDRRRAVAAAARA